MDAAARFGLLELAARHGIGRAVSGNTPPRISDYLGTLFPQQRSVCDSEALLNAVLTSRRSGKSSTTPALLYDAGHKHPGTVVFYIHPDGGQKAMETVMGPDINLGAINERYSLGWRVNLVERKLIHPTTRTEIRIRGADDSAEVKKFRGDKVSRVVIDEAQNFASDLLQRLVERDVGPALSDVQGQMFLLGTPGEVCSDADFWCSITRNDSPGATRRRGWLVHSWTALDNPHVRENFATTHGRLLANILEAMPPGELDALLEATPEESRPSRVVTDAGALTGLLLSGSEGLEAFVSMCALVAPHLLREAFGRWVQDGKGLLYAFDDVRNTYGGQLPPGHTWRHVLGGDLGTGDAYAEVVWAVAPTHPVMYEVESFKETGMDSEGWRLHLAETMARVRPVGTVVDCGGLGAGVVQGWVERHGMAVEAAEKTGKLAHIALMNAELRAGRIKVLAGGELAREWAALRRKPGVTGGELKVIGDDHASDSALYAWRRGRTLAGKVDAPAPSPGSAEARKQARDDEVRAINERIQRQKQSGMGALRRAGGIFGSHVGGRRR